MKRAHDPAYASFLRWLIVAVYTLMGWSACHDGTSAGDLAVMLVFGAIFLVLVVAVGWILDGPGQLDRPTEDEE